MYDVYICVLPKQEKEVPDISPILPTWCQSRRWRQRRPAFPGSLDGTPCEGEGGGQQAQGSERGAAAGSYGGARRKRRRRSGAELRDWRRIVLAAPSAGVVEHSGEGASSESRGGKEAAGTQAVCRLQRQVFPWCGACWSRRGGLRSSQLSSQIEQ